VPGTAALLERCRQGDDLAWEALIREFQGRVYGLAVHYVRDREEARDLAQEAFVRVYRALGTFDGRHPFASWILMVTRNLCIDHLRRKKVRPPASDVPADADAPIASADTSPEDHVTRSGRSALLYRALDRLTPINREIVLLKEIQGLSLDEIASELGVPVGTVKSRSSRARVELARQVLALDPGYGSAAP
jgi:RNA polymerase sigma-70 factor (ECF subfamily)